MMVYWWLIQQKPWIEWFMISKEALISKISEYPNVYSEFASSETESLEPFTSLNLLSLTQLLNGSIFPQGSESLPRC